MGNKGFIQFGRKVTREKIAHACLFLATDETSYVTGPLYLVDGWISSSKGTPGNKAPDDHKNASEKRF